LAKRACRATIGRVTDRERDAALFRALTETIDWELSAQLALAEVRLDRENIAVIAEMVADQVLVEFEVTPRLERPTPN
jgi:hypothetical protein